MVHSGCIDFFLITLDLFSSKTEFLGFLTRYLLYFTISDSSAGGDREPLRSWRVFMFCDTIPT